MARANAQSCGQVFEATALKRILGHEAEGAAYCARSAEPGGRARGRFRSAAETWPESRLGCRRCGCEVTDVPFPWRRGRTHRPTVDAGRLHADEEPAVEARIARASRSFEGLAIEFHGDTLAQSAGRDWPFSDLARSPSQARYRCAAPGRVTLAMRQL